MNGQQELSLKRFQTKGFEKSKSVSIHCKEGSIWVTAGNGLGDRIVYAGKELHLIATDKVVIEALEDSVTIISINADEAARSAEMPHHPLTANNSTI